MMMSLLLHATIAAEVLAVFCLSKQVTSAR
jgi:hypothetical protein